MKRLLLPAVVVLALVLAGLTAVRLLGSDDGTYLIKARFAGVPGLYEGNDVAVLGVPVGTVEKIEPHGTEVTVTLRVPTSLKVPEDVQAVIVPASLVTDRFVELTPAYTGGTTMKADSVIPLSRTRTPVEFDDVVRAVTGMAQDLTQLERGTGAIDEFLGVAATNARGNGAELRAAIQGASVAMSIFARNRGNTEELIRSLASLTELLAASDLTIRSFGRTITETVHFMAQESDNLNAALDSTLDLVLDVERFVRTHKKQIRASMTDLDVTARTLAGRSKELAEAIKLLPLVMQNFVRAYDPRTASLRVHAELFDGVLDSVQLTAICREVTRLPACSLPGDLLALGSDLGLTELILDTLSGAVR